MHSLVRLLLRLLTPLLAVLGLASCIEDETKLEINGDGSGRFRIVVKISPMLASATQKVGGGHLSDIKKFTEAMFNAMPSALVRGSSGVDVWTEAAITKDDRGWQILTLAGFFKDINTLQLKPIYSEDEGVAIYMVLGASESQARQAIRNGGLQALQGQSSFNLNWKLAPAADGTMEFTSLDWEKQLTSAAPPRVNGPLATEEEKVIAAKELSTTLDMLFALYADAWTKNLRSTQTVVVSGTLIDEGGMEKINDSSFHSHFNIKGLVPELRKRSQDQAKILSYIKANREPGMGILEDMVKDIKAGKFAKELFGKEGPRRVLFKPSIPLFDYEAEAAAAFSGMTPETRATLTKAWGADGIQRGKGAPTEKTAPSETKSAPAPKKPAATPKPAAKAS